MPNSSIVFLRTSTQEKVPLRAIDLGDGTYALAVSSPGSDPSNGVQRVAEIDVAGTLLTASGTSIEALGVLTRLVVANNGVAACTVAVFDNTAASGTKLVPDFTVPAGGIVNLELATPFALGVYLQLTGGTPGGLAFWRAVNG